MSTTNLYRALREILPEPPLLVATVVSTNTGTGTSLVEFPGGSQQTIRGTAVGVGDKAFVRNGVIENEAPDLTEVTIEV